MDMTRRKTSDQTVHGLWNLYQEELVSLLGQKANLVDELWSELFKKKELENLIRNVGREISSEERGGRLLVALKSCLSCQGAFDAILLLARTESYSTHFGGASLYSRLCCETLVDASKADLAKTVVVLNSFEGFMEPSFLLREGHISDSLFSHLSKFKEVIENTSRRELAVRVLIRELPYSGVEDWYWDFLNALHHSSADNNRRLIKVHFPNFQEEYEEHLRDKELRSGDTEFVDIGEPIERSLAVDFLTQHVPVRVEIDSGACGSHGRTDDCQMPEELRLRNYQEELADPALKGRNTIICAPTGSGKTWVAARIVLEHLSLAETNGNLPLVTFLVPTVPLVEQQERVLARFLPKQWKLGSIAGGDSEAPKNLMIQEYHVTVMTPQILLNMLGASEKADRLDIEKITLLIFDECHHCDQKHPYNEIMACYADKKFGGCGFSGGRKPQVVCLTASLGVGKGTDSLTEAVEHVLKLAANMDAEELAIVTKHQEELSKFMNMPDDQWKLIDGSHQNNLFTQLIVRVMELVEARIRPYVDSLRQSKMIDGVQAVPSEARNISQYGSWVYQLLAKVPQMENTAEKSQLIACLEHLRDYCLALELNAHLPAAQAVDFLKDKFGSLNPKMPIDKQLCRFYKERIEPKLEEAKMDPTPNLLVEELRKVLLEHRKNREDFRAIVFVKTRNLTTRLRDCLMNMEELRELNVEILTAVNASGEKGGQTPALQKKILDDFKSGKCKIIVATTVAEEGLDIEECNLIIKYNHVTNEIAMVQRRGRGRAEGSRSVLLALENWIAKKEGINTWRERLMQNAIQAVNEMGKAEFRNQVEQRGRNMYREREMQRAVAEGQKRESFGKKFNLMCRKCDSILCCSAEIRRVQASHFVSVEETIWERCNARPVSLEALTTERRIFAKLSIPGKSFCVRCDNPLGNVIKYSGVYFATLKADALVVQEVTPGARNTRKETAKQWKKITPNMFVVEEILRADILLMSSNPPNSKLAMDILLESETRAGATQT